MNFRLADKSNPNNLPAITGTDYDVDRTDLRTDYNFFGNLSASAAQDRAHQKREVDALGLGAQNRFSICNWLSIYENYYFTHTRTHAHAANMKGDMPQRKCIILDWT